MRLPRSPAFPHVKKPSEPRRPNAGHYLLPSGESIPFETSNTPRPAARGMSELARLVKTMRLRASQARSNRRAG